MFAFKFSNVVTLKTHWKIIDQFWQQPVNFLIRDTQLFRAYSMLMLSAQISNLLYQLMLEVGYIINTF